MSKLDGRERRNGRIINDKIKHIGKQAVRNVRSSVFSLRNFVLSRLLKIPLVFWLTFKSLSFIITESRGLHLLGEVDMDSELFVGNFCVIFDAFCCVEFCT